MSRRTKTWSAGLSGQICVTIDYIEAETEDEALAIANRRLPEEIDGWTDTATWRANVLANPEEEFREGRGAPLIAVRFPLPPRIFESGELTALGTMLRRMDCEEEVQIENARLKGEVEQLEQRLARQKQLARNAIWQAAAVLALAAAVCGAALLAI